MSRDLLDEREFLVRSLADAESEHDAGDLSDEDYLVLRSRDEERLAEVERRLDGGDTVADADSAAVADHVEGTDSTDGTDSSDDAVATKTDSDTRRAASRRRARIAGLVGTVLVVTGAVVLVVHLMTQRLPGQTLTGNVNLSQAQQITQELQQAGDLLNAGYVHDATKLYSTVLNQDPNDPQALAQLGWLAYEQGVDNRDSRYLAAGETLESRAIAAAPDFGPAHLYEGVMLGKSGDATAAVQQFKLFLSENPTRQNLRNGAPFIRQYYAEAHEPVPANVPAVPATTTTTPSTKTPSS